jgi:DNA processing protein
MTRDPEMKYWVAFSGVAGIGRVRMSRLKNHFGTLEDAWKAPEGRLRQAGLDSRTVDALLAVRQRLSPDHEIDRIDRMGVQALTCEDPLYPPALKEIHDYPPVLYVRGTLPPADGPCLAVVGTRRPTIYGRQVTEEIVTDLAVNGMVIVSGLARGIDSVAHRAALEAGGITLAVLAGGLDTIYPAENARLAQRIVERGALVSEHPPGTRPRPENFPLRNRIMSGLSLGVLVIEAGERSGALITANQALEQNREVFAVPGSILSPASRGTNRLIQEGAGLVSGYEDVLKELNLTPSPRQAEIEGLSPLDEVETTIVGLLSSEPNHIDEICHRSGLTMPQVGSTLAILELKRVVKHVGNMNYVLRRKD